MWVVPTAWTVVALLGLASVPRTDERSAQRPAVLARLELDAPVIRWQLPAALREISGLAMGDDGVLYALDDERAVIYALDLARQRVAARFAIGSPVVRGDFEGIAVVGHSVYLATSTGWLYEAPIGTDGQHVPYRLYDTGLGRRCELEGLAYEPAGRVLLLPCKHSPDRELRARVTVFAWSLVRREIDPGPRLQLAFAALRRWGIPRFRPSAIESLPGGDMLLLSAMDAAIVEIAPTGEVRALRRLGGSHRQPEGLAIGPDGSVVIADEGRGARGSITVYRNAR